MTPDFILNLADRLAKFYSERICHEGPAVTFTELEGPSGTERLIFKVTVVAGKVFAELSFNPPISSEASSYLKFLHSVRTLLEIKRIKCGVSALFISVGGFLTFKSPSKNGKWHSYEIADGNLCSVLGSGALGTLSLQDVETLAKVASVSESALSSSVMSKIETQAQDLQRKFTQCLERASPRLPINPEVDRWARDLAENGALAVARATPPPGAAAGSAAASAAAGSPSG